MNGKRMTKKWVALLLVLSMAILLSACASGKRDSSEEDVEKDEVSDGKGVGTGSSEIAPPATEGNIGKGDALKAPDMSQYEDYVGVWTHRFDGTDESTIMLALNEDGTCGVYGESGTGKLYVMNGTVVQGPEGSGKVGYEFCNTVRWDSPRAVEKWRGLFARMDNGAEYYLLLEDPYVAEGLSEEYISSPKITVFKVVDGTADNMTKLVTGEEEEAWRTMFHYSPQEWAHETGSQSGGDEHILTTENFFDYFELRELFDGSTTREFILVFKGPLPMDGGDLIAEWSGCTIDITYSVRDTRDGVTNTFEETEQMVSYDYARSSGLTGFRLDNVYESGDLSGTAVTITDISVTVNDPMPIFWE